MFLMCSLGAFLILDSPFTALVAKTNINYLSTKNFKCLHTVDTVYSKNIYLLEILFERVSTHMYAYVLCIIK